MILIRRVVRLWPAVAVLAAASVCFAAGASRNLQNPEAASSPILQAMQQELQRSVDAYSKATPPAYFVSYTVSDLDSVEVSGSNGALMSSSETRDRWLEVQTRVGSYELDNTHKIQGREPAWYSPGTEATLDDDIPLLRREIWSETDKQYRAAVQAYIAVQTSKEVEAQSAEQHAPDFSHEAPHVSISQPLSFRVDRTPWEERIRKYTAAFSASPAVLNSIATFTARLANQYFVNSDGSKIAFGQIRYRLELFVQGKAPDGMDLQRYANFDWVDPAKAPSDADVLKQVRVLTDQIAALQKAPLVEPFAGPTLLTGRAAAVFFHEVLGHRLEGFRQKDVSEGQTFTSKVGQQILPDFITVRDDPTTKGVNGQVLLGYYPFDDEGIPSQNVFLVDHGILKNFLMSRSPLVDFPHSNGHGRRQLGAQAIARMGNTIVESSKTMSNAALRKLFIEEIRKQNKPFGLLIDDIAGGFTFTGRAEPQAFQVQPLIVYKVFPDGRPDEMVRGVNIVGTPLISITKIIATGDTPEVFNGYCGAESGSVPVSAVAPEILISEMEVSKKETSTDTPPILPPPAHDPQAKEKAQVNQ
ncbi:MAG TPA: metallopeptidase TldD-related protein [Candidatus Acidoferrales bacterium]|jgi:TldD protein|nr:metallopeptidase TldD-related protein [Candidatus Acidoferrales bacterium]